MSRLKTFAYLTLAGVCWLFSTTLAQVVNIQLPEILGTLPGDNIRVGSLRTLTGDDYFNNNPADCTGKMDPESAGSFVFRKDDPWKDNLAREDRAHAVAVIGNVVGSHRYTLTCKNRLNGTEYAVSGRIEVTTLTSDALYGSKGLSVQVEKGFVNNSRNIYNLYGYFQLKIGEANMRKLTADGGDSYFKEGLLGPVTPAIFYDTGGVSLLPPFGFISIQQGCADAHSEQECIAIIIDHKKAVFFKTSGPNRGVVPRIIKTSERIVQSDDAFSFGGCYGANKQNGTSSWELFCWYFNPTTKTTKIVDTRANNKLPDVEVSYRIMESQNSGSRYTCFLIDDFKSPSLKVGCITVSTSPKDLNFFNELGQTATSTLNVTTNSGSKCMLPISSLSGNTAALRDMTAVGSCNSSNFSAVMNVHSYDWHLDRMVPNMSAPLRCDGEAVMLPPSSRISGFICKFSYDLVYFVTSNDNTEVHFQGTDADNIGRVLKTPLGLNGAVKILHTVCQVFRGATVIIEHNSARYILHVMPPEYSSPSLLTRIPIFEKISSTVDTYYPTGDLKWGILFNRNLPAGQKLQFSDVYFFRSLGYMVGPYNPAVTTPGSYSMKLTQKPDFNPAASLEISVEVFDASPQLTPKPALMMMSTNVNDDLQKYYSLSGNFSSISIENSTVLGFTPFQSSVISSGNYAKESRPVFVLGNEYLVNLQDGTFTNEKEGSVPTAITSNIASDARFIGVVDTPAGYQVAVLSTKANSSLQLVYFNNKSSRVEVTSLPEQVGTGIQGTAFHMADKNNEPSITVGVNWTSSKMRYVFFKYRVDPATGNLTVKSYEYHRETFQSLILQSKPVGQYMVQLLQYQRTKFDPTGSCNILTVMGAGIWSAMAFPVCALPSYIGVKHYFANATKNGNTLRVEVFSTSALPETGYGEAVVLEADIFDGASFRPNRDIVWKTTSLRKFQKFVGHVEGIYRNGDQELIIGRRKIPESLTSDSKFVTSSFVFSFFKADPATPFHQFEETNLEFAAGFEYKTNWFISMFNNTSGDHKTITANYSPAMLKLLPGADQESISTQSMIFNKGSLNEVRRAMRAISSPSKQYSGSGSASSIWLTVLISLLVIGVLGGLGYYYFFHRRETLRTDSNMNASRITAEH